MRIQFSVKYPSSCAGFQAWDSVQALCSYVRGMLTSQALLAGVGVGRVVRAQSCCILLTPIHCAAECT